MNRHNIGKKGGAAIRDNATSRELVSKTPKNGKRKDEHPPAAPRPCESEGRVSHERRPNDNNQTVILLLFPLLYKFPHQINLFSHINLDGNPKRSFNQIEMPSKSQGEL